MTTIKRRNKMKTLTVGSNGMAGSVVTRQMMILKVLLFCGIISSVLYIGTDILAAAIYRGYSYTSQQVSELSAIGAPTRPLWIAMSSIWTPLVIAFAISVWQSAGLKRSLRIAGALLVAFAVVGTLWGLIAPMHVRGTIGSVAESDTDIMHIVFAGIQVLVMVLFIAFGSGAFGRGFRFYSIGTIGVMLVFGAWAGTRVSAIAAGQPTPWFGLIERVSVYAPILWVLVFAIVLLRAAKGIEVN
jgi:Protein of unknown function (DUF998)